MMKLYVASLERQGGSPGGLVYAVCSYVSDSITMIILAE